MNNDGEQTIELPHYSFSRRTDTHEESVAVSSILSFKRSDTHALDSIFGKPQDYPDEQDKPIDPYIEIETKYNGSRLTSLHRESLRKTYKKARAKS